MDELADMTSTRLWEIDALRGAAVVLMIVFHFFFDLNFLGLASFALYEGPLLLLQRTTAFLFLSLVGVSLVLSKPSLERVIKRFLFLASIALLITTTTWFYPGRGFIVFGIIHLIALSVLIGYFFLRFSVLSLVLGLLLLSLPSVFSFPSLDHPFLLWLGFPLKDFYTLDYYPLLPWFGLVLIGIFLGKKLVPHFGRLAKPNAAEVFCWIGRRSLWIYLAHQPILVGILLVWRVLF